MLWFRKTFRKAAAESRSTDEFVLEEPGTESETPDGLGRLLKSSPVLGLATVLLGLGIPLAAVVVFVVPGQVGHEPSLDNPSGSADSVATHDSPVTKPVAGGTADQSSVAISMPQRREARKIPADATPEELKRIGKPTPAQVRVTERGVDPADRKSSSLRLEPPLSPSGLSTAGSTREIQPRVVPERKESKPNANQESWDGSVLAIYQASDAMIRRGDYTTANHQIIEYRKKHPNFALTPRRDHRELLELQKLIREKILASMPRTAGQLERARNRHEVAIVDHDLMNAYRIIDNLPNLTQQYFLSAEAGYTACLAAVEQLEQNGITSEATKDELQLITSNLAELYITWAEYKRENTSLQKADELLAKSETLLPFAVDQVTARVKLSELRSRLRKLLQKS